MSKDHVKNKTGQITCPICFEILDYPIEYDGLDRWKRPRFYGRGYEVLGNHFQKNHYDLLITTHRCGCGEVCGSASDLGEHIVKLGPMATDHFGRVVLMKSVDAKCGQSSD